MSKGAKAWLLTWERDGDHVKLPEERVIAVLSPRRSSRYVKELVDIVWAQHSLTPAEKLAAMRDPGSRAYEAQFNTRDVTAGGRHLGRVPFDGQIVCGGNPFVYARLVQKLLAGGQDGQDLAWEEISGP